MTPYAFEMLRVAGSTLAIYLFLIVVLRLLGRRHLGQLTVVDLVIIVVLGSAVETAMVAGDVSLPAGLVSAATLLAADRLATAALSRSRRLRRLVVGGPLLLVYNGRLLADHLRRAGLTEDDVLEGLRERGWDGVAAVRFAVLEVDGSINAVGKA